MATTIMVERVKDMNMEAKNMVVADMAKNMAKKKAGTITGEKAVVVTKKAVTM